jgi:hypothetical protein
MPSRRQACRPERFGATAVRGEGSVDPENADSGLWRPVTGKTYPMLKELLESIRSEGGEWVMAGTLPTLKGGKVEGRHHRDDRSRTPVDGVRVGCIVDFR